MFIPTWSLQTFKEVKELFVPQSPDRAMITGKECIVVKVRPFIKESTKYFMVDINITMKPSFMKLVMNKEEMMEKKELMEK